METNHRTFPTTGIFVLMAVIALALMSYVVWKVVDLENKRAYVENAQNMLKNNEEIINQLQEKIDKHNELTKYIEECKQFIKQYETEKESKQKEYNDLLKKFGELEGNYKNILTEVNKQQFCRNCIV